MSDDRTRYWQVPVLGGLECLHADFRTKRFASHFHDTFSMGVVTRGVNIFDYKHAVVEAPRGTVCLAEPGETHTGGRAEEGWEYWNLHISVETMKALAQEFDETRDDIPAFASGVFDDPYLRGLFLQMFAALAPSPTILDDPGRILEQESWATITLGALIARHSVRRRLRFDASDTSTLGARVRQILRERWAEPLRLSDLERETGMGRFRLLRAFAKESDLTPHAFLVQVRLSRAKALLLSGCGVAEVAAQTGFADQAHMTRVFRRFLGVTPGMVAAARK